MATHVKLNLKVVPTSNPIENFRQMSNNYGPETGEIQVPFNFQS
jgi:hypothetical protein